MLALIQLMKLNEDPPLDSDKGFDKPRLLKRALGF